MTTTATRDEFLRAVGEVAHLAAWTDTLLFSVFARVSDCPGAVAKAVYYLSDSMHQKARLVNAVARATCSPAAIGCIEKIGKYAEDAHRHRQKIAHSMVAEKQDGSAAVINFKQGKMFEPITRAELTDLVELANECRKNAIAEFQQVGKLIPPPKLDIPINS